MILNRWSTYASLAYNAGSVYRKRMSAVETTLAERATSHGDFGDHAHITQALKALMHGPGWERANDSEREALQMIAHKMGRICAGNPHFHDHWLDIAGYATLVADRIAQNAH